MSRSRIARATCCAAAVVAAALLVVQVQLHPAAGAATIDASVNGQGSTYAALAFQTWTQGAEINLGLNVNYTATGSPAGLSAYAANTATFAGTEAEYSELYPDTPDPTAHVPRGFAYTPDVAGAIAVMYHVHTPSGTTVGYLHLTPLTIARIFMRYITWWTSPTISLDNKGLVLPHEPITLDLRSGQSGTTALFYDWVKHSDPSQFTPWAEANHFPTSSRIWEVDDGTAFGSGPGFNDLSGSDQQAEAIASPSGLWSIGYDEFGYAYVYHDNVAWVRNASGNWTQPYAKNIAAALKSAVLLPTTAQTLVGVYNSTTPNAYPMSAYSYILYQCAPTPARATCKGAYSNQGIINTMSKFMRYVACTGQVKMAQIGYSPLPADLSQFLANAIGYMTNSPPPVLTATNCSNPQFKGGDLGVGATPPPDPTAGVSCEGPGPGGCGSSGSSGSSSSSSSSGRHTSAVATSNAGSSSSSGSSTTKGLGGAEAVGVSGSSTAAAVGGGTTEWASTDPVPYTVADVTQSGPPVPLLLLVVLLLGPVVWFGASAWRRTRARPAPSRNSQGPQGPGEGEMPMDR